MEMPHLLHIDSSVQGDRSISRRLTARARDAWGAAHPDGTVTYRDTNAARHVTPGESAAEVARHAFMVGADRAFLVATMLLAATVLLTFFAIRPTAPQATDTQASDDPAPVEV
jgi:hypothetical protein